ncbi:MAG: PAS domain-containing protein, partial [Gammaproteobacteria bacterium]|nr:PAS domain-containing protein [Gammaproteobacteria bacterium]
MTEKNKQISTEIETVLPIVQNAPHYYIGIGASAGGLEAIDSFISNTSDKTDLAFIIVQHLSPDYKSLMVELLSKFTKMNVYRAENQMQVERNCIYLIPPKKNLTIFHGRLMLSDQDRSASVNLPIDIFFQSLAEDQENRAIGIILSGTGSDGTRGVRTIKEKGGMVMVQDENSAKFDGMPRSAISTGLADFVLPPEEMPNQLLNFTKHPYAAAQQEISNTLLSDEDGMTRIFFLLREKCKVDFTFYKPSTVIRRLERRMTINKIHDLKEYVQFLEHFPEEIKSLYRELLIGVTRFFRDADAFNEIELRWLPELIQDKQGSAIRFWVAGCSTGEEAYSLAIMCREIMNSLGITKDIKIFATDVDNNAIQRASTGTYTESIVADISPRLTAKYFFHKEDSFQIIRSIREMVVFAQHDILKDPPFTNIDFVTCRNVMIYFQSVLQKRALEMFNFALNQGGLLFLGSSETIGDLTNLFEPLNNKEKIYRSFGKRQASLNNEQIGKYANRHYFRQLPSSGKAYKSSYADNDEKILERFVNVLSDRYIPLTIVVNEEMEIIHIFGDTQGYFILPSGKMENNLTKMSRKEFSIPLATGISKVFKTGNEQRYSNIQLPFGDEKRTINLNMTLLDSKRSQQSLVAVFFENVTKSVEAHNLPDNNNYDVSKETEQRITDLEQELQFTRENLQATVEELETSNEELQATNEELLASNEELQSTNEELQSVNEELYTVNAEHQSKIVELLELNNDLDNLLISTDIATIFLDEDLELRKFTPDASNFFQILDNDLGRPISHIQCILNDIDIIVLINHVKSSNEILEQEVQIKEGLWYLMRILPYHIAPNIFSGVVLTFVSIDKLKRTQNELSANMKRYTLTQYSAHFGVWEWDMNSDEVHWSEGVEPIFGLNSGEFKNTLEHFMQFVHPNDLDMVNSAIEKAINNKTKYSLEHRIIWPDGRIHWVDEFAEVSYDENQTPVNMIGVVRDITEQKETQINLINSEHIFRSTLENLDMVAVQLDIKGNITFVNQYLCTLSGWRKEDILGKNWITLFIPEEQRSIIRESFHDFISGNIDIPKQYSNTIVCKNG